MTKEFYLAEEIRVVSFISQYQDTPIMHPEIGVWSLRSKWKQWEMPHPAKRNEWVSIWYAWEPYTRIFYVLSDRE